LIVGWQGTVECAHELRCFPEGAPNPHQLVVTGVAWNESGNVVAASLGRHDVEGWCAAPGALVSWNLVRRDLDPGRPDSQLETDSCLMCCAFHPRHPVSHPPPSRVCVYA
jgi:hypothetical protein